MRHLATVARRASTAAGVSGVIAGCAGMAAMLPGAAAGALGAIGIGGSSVLARTLSPFAEPLFVASAVLLVLAALACSRLVAATAIVGNLLLYLSMFQLATGGGGSMSMMAMRQHSSRALHAEPLNFYTGLALVTGAVALSIWRRRHRHCRPILRLPHPSPLSR